MSTVVCQGLQSCLESQLVETRTTLRLKLASPTKPSHNEETNHNNSSNLDLGGWSFLQSLSNTSQNPSQNPKQALERESFYVHPMEKRSLSTLSDKSLELCTENLGSETGTDMIETSIFSFHKMDTMLSVHKSDSEEGGDKPKPRLLQGMENSGKANNCRDFPPPLTTMTGCGSIQVRPHREGGRLIIQAIEAPTNHSYLQAERSHGRLRLSFWRDCCDTTFDSEMGCEENEEECDMEEVENEEEKQDFEEKEEEGFEKEEEEEEEEEEDDYDDEREDMEGNSLEVEVEMGMEKFQRPSRCKEGGHGNNGLCNWETFWVATS
ncbi:hypothetical protein HYC85_019385 [Camellia sinensis]|uniref:FAF domain-containing protein n=1 Tax=Camellia sinensis TaxID=4442 RepID=A0A7J7GLN2_CAMSI|nr:hypothetical protein HYC85_019385 [Camellia sinensis]